MIRVSLTLTIILAFLAAGAASTAPAPRARCVVSGKEIEITEKTPRAYVQGKPVYFCSADCPKSFAKSPEKFLKTLADCPILGGAIMAPDSMLRGVVNGRLWYVCCDNCLPGLAGSSVVLKELDDPVSGKRFTGTGSSPRSDYMGQVYFFTSAETKAAFDKEPGKYAVVYGK